MNTIDIAKDYIPQREVMILQPKGHSPVCTDIGAPAAILILETERILMGVIEAIDGERVTLRHFKLKTPGKGPWIPGDETSTHPRGAMVPVVSAFLDEGYLA